MLLLQVLSSSELHIPPVLMHWVLQRSEDWVLLRSSRTHWLLPLLLLLPCLSRLPLLLANVFAMREPGMLAQRRLPSFGFRPLFFLLLLLLLLPLLLPRSLTAETQTKKKTT